MQSTDDCGHSRAPGEPCETAMVELGVYAAAMAAEHEVVKVSIAFTDWGTAVKMPDGTTSDYSLKVGDVQHGYLDRPPSYKTDLPEGSGAIIAPVVAAPGFAEFKKARDAAAANEAAETNIAAVLAQEGNTMSDVLLW